MSSAQGVSPALNRFVDHLSKERRDYVKMLADYEVRGELWFEIEMMKVFEQIGLRFDVQSEYLGKYWADFVIYEEDGKENLLEVKVMLNRGKSYSILGKRELQDVKRLAEAKDPKYNKWFLVIAYPHTMEKWKKEYDAKKSQHPELQEEAIYHFPIGADGECLLIL